MKIIDTKILCVKVIEQTIFGDDSRFFMENWNEVMFSEADINENFVQDNYSRSVKNTLRGLQHQINQS